MDNKALATLYHLRHRPQLPSAGELQVQVVQVVQVVHVVEEARMEEVEVEVVEEGAET